MASDCVHNCITVSLAVDSTPDGSVASPCQRQGKLAVESKNAAIEFTTIAYQSFRDCIGGCFFFFRRTSVKDVSSSLTQFNSKVALFFYHTGNLLCRNTAAIFVGPYYRSCRRRHVKRTYAVTMLAAKVRTDLSMSEIVL